MDRHSARQEVARLLSELTSIAKCLPAVTEDRIAGISDRISVITSPYMEPKVPADWLAADLTEQQRQIVDLLASRPGHPFSRDAIMNRLYFDRADPPESKTLDVQICKARQKLKKVNSAYQIKTIWGRGYALAA